MAAPAGNQNAAKGKRFASALESRIAELDAMKDIVNELIIKALDGDMAAIKEIADRIDGKCKQQIDIGGQEDNPLLSEIRVRLVKADDSSSAGS